MIPMFQPAVGAEEVQAVTEVIESGWLGLGPKTDRFEAEFAEYLGSRFAIGLNSHAAALDLALKLLDIGPGDEVILPTIGFLTAAHAVVHNGATPIFADILPDTLTLDPDDLAGRITMRTKAVIASHYAGHPCDIDRLREQTGRQGIRIIEDAAEACGAEYKGRKVGTLGDVACFSFHPVKNLAMGDGGAITTNDEWLAERARRLRWLGVGLKTWEQTGQDPPYWRRYTVEEIALKCHMNDLMAAIGLVQLRKLDANNARREEIARLYHEGLRNIRDLERPLFARGKIRSAWSLYPIQCGRRDALNAWLREQSIASEVHYTPLHTYSCYGNRPALPVAEKASERTLSLPIYPGLGDVQVFKVINAVKAFFMKDRPRFAGRPRAVKEQPPAVPVR